MSASRVGDDASEGAFAIAARWVFGALGNATVPVWVLAVLSKVEQFVGAIDFVGAGARVISWLTAILPPAASLARPMLNFAVDALMFVRHWYEVLFHTPLRWVANLLGVKGSPQLYDWIIFAVSFAVVTWNLAARAYEAQSARAAAEARRQAVGDDNHAGGGAVTGAILGTMVAGPLGAIVGGVIGGIWGANTPTEEAKAAHQAAFDAEIAATAAGSALVKSVGSTILLSVAFTAVQFLFR